MGFQNVTTQTGKFSGSLNHLDTEICIQLNKKKLNVFYLLLSS